MCFGLFPRASEKLVLVGWLYKYLLSFGMDGALICPFDQSELFWVPFSFDP